MSLRRPPLADRHADAGAKTTEFGGWEMPVEFDSIRTEHRAVRESVGTFDVSHMGQLEISGPDAAELTDRLTTNDIASLAPGGARYTAITDESGIMLDDTVVYRLPEGGGPVGDAGYLLVPNAGTDEATEARFEAHADEWGLNVAVHNATEEYGMFAVQGPDAIETLAESCRAPGEVSRFSVADRTVAGIDCLLARTGYTGEDGAELLFDAADSEQLWDAVAERPCGLGARDTLRLEAGFLLAGQEFDPETNPRTPYEAGIDFVVDTSSSFVGRDALAAPGADDPDERLVGFRLTERGIPRNGYPILADGEAVGEVTSGTMSPTVGEPIGMGYVPGKFTDPGTEIAIEIRGEPKQAVVESLPFYER